MQQIFIFFIFAKFNENSSRLFSEGILCYFVAEIVKKYYPSFAPNNFPLTFISFKYIQSIIFGSKMLNNSMF